jgi:hypothetical protein
MSHSTHDIARICHEVNRAYCAALGDTSQPAWDDAPEWQQSSVVAGVIFVASNPDAPASTNHNAWLEQKLNTGWRWGEVKNPDTKEHPCMVPYDDLPVEQRAKDHIFRAIVVALTPPA